MKKCPFCAEEIQDEAIKCRYCGEWLEKREDKSIAGEFKNLYKSILSGVKSNAPVESGTEPVSAFGRLQEAVEKRKQRCRDLGVYDFMSKLFFKIPNYPEQFKNKSISSLITDVKELEKENRDDKEWKRVQFTLKEKKYICAYEERNAGGHSKFGTFELYADGKNVIAVSMAFDGSEWTSTDIEAFIEGDWFNDLKELAYKT